MWWDIYPTSRKRENDDLGQKVLQEDQIPEQYGVDKLKGWSRWSLVPSLQKEAGKRKRHKYRVVCRFVDERNRYICFLDFLCEIWHSKGINGWCISIDYGHFERSH